MRVVSVAIDRIALVMAVLFGCAVALWTLLAVGNALQGRWLMVAVFGGLALLFTTQLYGWGASVKAKVEVDADGARRLGPVGHRWDVPAEALAEAEVRSVRGVPYLIAREPGRTKRSLTALLVPAAGLDAVAAPLEQEQSAQIATAVGR